MNWEQYLKEVFTVFRQEFIKLTDEEKALAQLNITFSQPCQIEVLEFSDHTCQALIVTFFEDFPDMDIIVYADIMETPEEFILGLAKEKDKWKMFNAQQLQSIVQAIRNCPVGERWHWSYIGDRACVYTRSYSEELSPEKFASMKITDTIQQINVRKRNKEIENAIPIPIELIPKSNGQVSMKFTVPFELVEDGDYDVSIQGHNARVSIRSTATEEHFEKVTGFKISKSGGGSVRLVDDTKGISVVSQVEILIPYLTDEIYFLQLALEYMNRLLDVWRFVTGKFWLIEAVSDRDIISMSWEKRYPSGKIYNGMFAIGLPGQISVPAEIRKTSDALPLINKFLTNNAYIPLFQMLKLNALKHYSERRYGLAIIEVNIALEDYVAQYLVKKLLEKGVSEEEISKRINKYDTCHKMLDKGLKDALGHSLKEDAELWSDFNRMRTIRKNAVHPFVGKTTYKDASDVFNITQKIAKWISEK